MRRDSDREREQFVGQRVRDWNALQVRPVAERSMRRGDVVAMVAVVVAVVRRWNANGRKRGVVETVVRRKWNVRTVVGGGRSEQRAQR